MTINNILCLFLIAILGCSSSSYFSEQSEVLVSSDPYSSKTTVTGISKRQKFDSGGIGGLSTNSFLRSFVDNDSKITLHQIYIESVYLSSDWNFFERAHLLGGEELKVQKIDSNVECSAYTCTYEETIGVLISDERIKELATGFSVKIYGNSGNDFVLQISKDQINSQLESLNQAQ